MTNPRVGVKGKRRVQCEIIDLSTGEKPKTLVTGSGSFASSVAVRVSSSLQMSFIAQSTRRARHASN